MKDVAALAGVSVGTVSNVLNTPARVAPGTRERVQMAIDKLGWVRNETARQLRAGHSNTIGIVVLDVANPYFTDVLKGAEEFLYGQGFSVYIGNSDQYPEREVTLLQHFQRNQVQGVLLAPIGASSEEATLLVQRRIPVVLMDRADNPDFCGVGADDIEGGRLAIKHLLEQGHQKLSFVGGPSALPQVRDRRRGAELALEASAEEGSLLVISSPTLDVASGRSAAEEILALPEGERPTAVFGANDLIAIGMLQGFVSAGLRIPEDIAIIGYDDVEFAAAAAVPLSSIRQPRQKIGEKSAELLFEEIEALAESREHQHQTVRFAPELVARQSTLGR